MVWASLTVDPSQAHVGMKTDGNGREITLTVFTFTFYQPDGNENGKAENENDHGIAGYTKTNKSERKYVGTGQKPVIKIGNV